MSPPHHLVRFEEVPEPETDRIGNVRRRRGRRRSPSQARVQLPARRADVPRRVLSAGGGDGPLRRCLLRLGRAPDGHADAAQGPAPFLVQRKRPLRLACLLRLLRLTRRCFAGAGPGAARGGMGMRAESEGSSHDERSANQKTKRKDGCGSQYLNSCCCCCSGAVFTRAALRAVRPQPRRRPRPGRTIPRTPARWPRCLPPPRPRPRIPPRLPRRPHPPPSSRSPRSCGRRGCGWRGEGGRAAGRRARSTRRRCAARTGRRGGRWEAGAWQGCQDPLARA